ncbi:MAG TPA: hypothetical protein VH720_06105 [Candidatus Limnocylindrales bacterium]
MIRRSAVGMLIAAAPALAWGCVTSGGPSASAATSGTTRPSAASDASAPTPGASPTLVPSSSDGGPPVGPLAPGTYRAHLEPAFAFTVGEGWERRVPDEEVSARYLMLLYASGGGGRLLYVDVSDLGVTGSLERFLRLTFSRESEPVPAAIGGVTGLRTEVGRAPVPTVIQGVAGEYVLNPTDVARVVAVEVDGTTLTFIAESGEGGAASFWPIVDEVLSSVAFE